jgi:chromatin segregation and condensation protein Rec8/ScpA/Scc1 (kleisin family)
VTVHEKIELITRMVRQGRAITFTEVLHSAGSRVEVVVSLWAVLEMIKRGWLQARQNELFGEITLHEPATSNPEI